MLGGLWLSVSTRFNSLYRAKQSNIWPRLHIHHADVKRFQNIITFIFPRGIKSINSCLNISPAGQSEKHRHNCSGVSRLPHGEKPPCAHLSRELQERFRVWVMPEEGRDSGPASPPSSASLPYCPGLPLLNPDPLN